jgi:hypothetical protein
MDGHRDTCCCNHGGRCTCAHKKELNQLDPVPESDSDKETASTPSTKPAPRRRRANTIHSDGVLTFDENGHHKPTHKHTKASQKCGPYQLNRVHSVHSTSSLSNRSVDNLLHKSTEPRKRGSTSSRSSQEQRLSKSETASPQISGASNFQQVNPGLPPLDLSSIEYPPYMAGFDLFNGFTEEPPLLSAGIPTTTSVDWNGYDGLPRYQASSFGTGSAFGGFEFGSEQPGLTSASNSGDVSEVEDFMSANNDEGFRLSTNSSYIGLSQGQAAMLASPDVNHLTFDDFLKNANNKFLPTPPSMEETFAPAGGFSSAEDALWASNYTERSGAIPDSPVEAGASFWDTQ